MGYNTSIKQLSSSCLVNCLGDCRVLPRVIAERRWRALCFSRQRLSGIISWTVFFYSFLQVYKPILSRKNAKVNSFQNTRRAKVPQSQSPCGFEALFQIPVIPLVSSKGKELEKPRLARGVFRSCGSDKGAALDPPSGGTRRVAEGASFSCPLWGSVCRSHSIKGRVVFSPLRSENLHPLALDSVPA